MVETTGEWRMGEDVMSDRLTARTSASGGPQAARSTIHGSLFDGTLDGSLSIGSYVNLLNDSDSSVFVRNVSHSVDKVCYIRSDDYVYDKQYLDAYDLKDYGYAKVATEMVEFLLAVRTPPANANKFKKSARARRQQRNLSSSKALAMS
jgi:hypothetical protein